MTDWMKIALSLRIGQDAEDARLNEIREAGVVLLKKKRSKSFDRPPEELAAAFRGVETGLIAVTGALRGFREALGRSFAAPDEMVGAFEADRARFRDAFTRLYLDAPAATQAQEV